METNSDDVSKLNSAPEETEVPGKTALPPAFHPHVLLVHWEINVRNRQWPSACSTAQALIAALPQEPIGWIYRSFAWHQMGRIREAWLGLLPAAKRFPQDWRIAYNLACYAGESGDVAGAWNWLDRAIELGDADAIKSAALDEPSFKRLWAGLGKSPDEAAQT